MFGGKVGCWMVLEHHGTANAEEWKDLMMAGFDLARENYVWWGVWVLESSHLEAGTRLSWLRYPKISVLI